MPIIDRGALVLTGALLLSANLPLFGADTPETPPIASASLSGMERSLHRLAAAMERTVEQQETSLRLRQVELSSLLLVQLESQLIQMEDERSEYAEMVESTTDALERQRELRWKETSSERAEDLQESIRLMESELDRLKDRLEALESRLSEGQSRASELRHDLAEWRRLVAAYFSRSRESAEREAAP